MYLAAAGSQWCCFHDVDYDPGNNADKLFYGSEGLGKEDAIKLAKSVCMARGFTGFVKQTLGKGIHQNWLRNEIRSLLIGAPVQLHTQLRVKDHGLADTVDATGAPKWVVAEMLSRMLENSHTTAFLQKIGLLSEIRKELAEFSKTVLLDLWIERVISRVPYVPIPDFTDFREASTEEQEGIICLMHEFHMYLIHVAKIDVNATTHRAPPPPVSRLLRITWSINFNKPRALGNFGPTITVSYANCRAWQLTPPVLPPTPSSRATPKTDMAASQ